MKKRDSKYYFLSAMEFCFYCGGFIVWFRDGLHFIGELSFSKNNFVVSVFL